MAGHERPGICCCGALTVSLGGKVPFEDLARERPGHSCILEKSLWLDWRSGLEAKKPIWELLNASHKKC